MASSPAPTGMTAPPPPNPPPVQFHQPTTSMSGLIPQSPSPHLTSSPIPQNIQIAASQAGVPNQIQFGQPASSIQGVMPQSPTVLQTVAPGTLQFSSQMPVLQQGQLNAGSYIQPVFPGHQQMLLPSGAIAIQQPAMNQAGAIAVKPGSTPKMISVADSKQGGAQKPQVVTSQASAPNKLLATPQKAAQTGQIIGSPNQAHVMTQQGPNGQTLVISHPLNVLPQGNIMQTHQSLQPQHQMNAKGPQQKFMGNTKGAQPIQLAGVQQPYRHINSGGAQQILSANGQPVLSQTQILQPLQAFNAFGGGLSWTGQLQGNPILQQPILIRNQHDGSMYIQSAPGTTSQQQLQQVQQQLQNTTQLGQQVPTMQPMQGVIPGMVHGVGAGTLVGTQTLNQTSTPTLHLSNQAHQTIQSQGQQQGSIPGSTQGSITIQANGQVVLAPQNPQSSNGQEQLQGQTPLTNVKDAVGNNTQNQQGSATCQSQPIIVSAPLIVNQAIISDIPLSGSCDDPMKPQDQEQLRNNSQPAALIEPRIMLPNAMPTVMSPMKTQQSSVTVVTLPDLPEPEVSTSPAIAETYPQDADEEPRMEEAAEILTHIIHGYVIHEGPDPFPVGRRALLTEKLRKEHETLFGAREKEKQLKEEMPPKEAIIHIEEIKVKENTEDIVPEATPTSNNPEPSTKSPAKSDDSDSFSSIHPSKWNVQQVCAFVRSVPGCSQYAEEFLSQEIDGEALLFLKRENLMSRINIKLGPAAKICVRLGQLDSEKS